MTGYGCQGRALLARRRDIFVLFKNVSPRTLDCRGALWKLAGEGKGGCSGFVACPRLSPLLVSFLRSASLTALCTPVSPNLSLALPTPRSSPYFLPSFHTHLWRLPGLRAG